MICCPFNKLVEFTNSDILPNETDILMSPNVVESLVSNSF